MRQYTVDIVAEKRLTDWHVSGHTRSHHSKSVKRPNDEVDRYNVDLRFHNRFCWGIPGEQ